MQALSLEALCHRLWNAESLDSGQTCTLSEGGHPFQLHYLPLDKIKFPLGSTNFLRIRADKCSVRSISCLPKTACHSYCTIMTLSLSLSCLHRTPSQPSFSPFPPIAKWTWNAEPLRQMLPLINDPFFQWATQFRRGYQSHHNHPQWI